MVAMTFAFAGALATPAMAQSTVFDGPCQIVEAGETPIQTNCTVVFDEANDTCTVTAGDDTFQEVGGCADIVQGECPFQLIDGTTIIQLQCDGDGVPTVEPTVEPTPVTPGVTPTATPETPGVTPTATPETPGVTPTDDVTPPDDDDDVTPPDDEEDAPPADDADEVVEALPDTGQGPSDTNQSGILVALLGAMSALMAGAAFLFQRRTQA
jgi:hypothetical protein